jgi:hypothetical protein
MGFLTRFIRNHTKPDGPKPVFQDASSRTSFLKRTALQKEDRAKPIIKKKLLDKNELNHRINLLRSSGGIPKKCNLRAF